jgi:thiol-disulfide isomerase/thioredoxin
LAAIGSAAEWLNSPRLAASVLAGKVVLVDFCTYTCINWLRTLPYVRAWAQKYRQGLVVVGVHTPEFAFEKNVDNVRRAVRRLGIEYPIAIDNDYSIWRAFKNEYWPALYFIDARGRVRAHHFGEGAYERSERAIQRLVAETGVAASDDRVVSVDVTGVEIPADWDNLKSPEITSGTHEPRTSRRRAVPRRIGVASMLPTANPLPLPTRLPSKRSWRSSSARGRLPISTRW